MEEEKRDIHTPVIQAPDFWLELIEVGDEARMRSELEQLHPADIAVAIERLPLLLQPTLFNLLDDEIAAEVIAELDVEEQENLIEQLTNSETARLFDHLDSDDAADLLGLMDDADSAEILSGLSADDQRDLTELMGYDEESAGGIMAKEAVSALVTASVGEVIEHVRTIGREIDDIYNVYLIDESQRLVGYVSLRDLILASPDQNVAELMDQKLISVNVNMDQEEVAGLFSKYDLVSAPVVNKKRRLLGRITHDDILDVLEDEIHEDMAHFTGQSEFDPGERSVLRNMRHRLPWLMLGLAGGIVTATMIARFEPQIVRITSLVFFLPLIAAMGGNVGIQTSSLIVRGLATGEVGQFGIMARLIRELTISLMTGAISGGVLIAATIIWQGSVRLALVVGVSLMIVIVMAATIGAVVPLMLKRSGMDPALATGPFITTTNDIIGLLIYLWIATAFL